MAIIVKNPSWEVGSGQGLQGGKTKIQLSGNCCQKLCLGGGSESFNGYREGKKQLSGSYCQKPFLGGGLWAKRGTGRKNKNTVKYCCQKPCLGGGSESFKGYREEKNKLSGNYC